MESQFDRPVPARIGMEAEKWDHMKPGLSPDIVPLSVADMEFNQLSNSVSNSIFPP